MFGYVRPRKSELLVREFTRYRAVYCGICKCVGANYGQLPRLGVNYDMVLLGLLLLSLSEEAPDVLPGTCLLNPFRKKPIAVASPALDACAAVTVLLAWYKGRDDQADGHWVRGRVIRMLFSRARLRAETEWPNLALMIRQQLDALHVLEQTPPDPASAEKAAALFGTLTGQLFALVTTRVVPDLDSQIQEALALMGDRTGRWIYLMDAIDDRQTDADNGNWNPLAGLPPETAEKQAESMLIAWEEEMDRTCALLPYVRDANIIRNIVQEGLADVRTDTIAGRKSPRL